MSQFSRPRGGGSVLVVFPVVLALATGCGGHSRRLADGPWYGKLVGVDVAQRTVTFAPACRLNRSGRWTPVADRGPATVAIAPHSDLEIYYRPNGDAAAGHLQRADLALLADVASHAQLPESPPGWFVTTRDDAAVSIQEDSGIRSSGRGDKRTFACAWSRSTQAFVRRSATDSTATTGRWKHVTVVRHLGRIEASLSYDRRGLDEYRRLTLVVRRAGRIVIRGRDDGHVRIGAVQGLSLRNVWGSADPEALVELWTGGNRCCLRLQVGLVDDRDRGRVLVQDFPTYAGGRGQWHSGRFDFVSADRRFDCAFTFCADESQPIRILAIDKVGTRFVDVTRSRPDLIRADAAEHWRWIKRGSEYPVGELAPWCADEYLLGQKERCERVLAEVRRHDRLEGWHRAGGADAFIRFLHDRLRAWGYG